MQKKRVILSATIVVALASGLLAFGSGDYCRVHFDPLGCDRTDPELTKFVQP